MPKKQCAVVEVEEEFNAPLIPFVTVTPSLIQVSLGKDALMALGWPPYILWDWSEREDLFFRLSALSKRDAKKLLKAGVVEVKKVTYCKGRPTALSTIPREYRAALEPKGVKKAPAVSVAPRLPYSLQSLEERKKSEKAKPINKYLVTARGTGKQQWIEFSPTNRRGNSNIQEVQT